MLPVNFQFGDQQVALKKLDRILSINNFKQFSMEIVDSTRDAILELRQALQTSSSTGPVSSRPGPQDHRWALYLAAIPSLLDGSPSDPEDDRLAEKALTLLAETTMVRARLAKVEGQLSGIAKQLNVPAVHATEGDELMLAAGEFNRGMKALADEWQGGTLDLKSLTTVYLGKKWLGRVAAGTIAAEKAIQDLTEACAELYQSFDKQLVACQKTLKQCGVTTENLAYQRATGAVASKQREVRDLGMDNRLSLIVLSEKLSFAAMNSLRQAVRAAGKEAEAANAERLRREAEAKQIEKERLRKAAEAERIEKERIEKERLRREAEDRAETEQIEKERKAASVIPLFVSFGFLLTVGASAYWFRDWRAFEASLWTGGVGVLCCCFSVSCHFRGKIPKGYFKEGEFLAICLLSSLVAALLQLVGGILHAIWNYFSPLSPSWLNSVLPLGWAELFGFLVVAPVMIVTAFAFGAFYYYSVWMIILRVRQRR